MMLESCLTFEPYLAELEDYSLFDRTQGSIHVLGKEFRTRNETERLKDFVTSRLWFTYRKNFRPIGGTGPTTDQGWGCMLRCGQMLLAQALIVLHLGKNWMWNRDAKEEKYKRILRMFQDDKNALYSLHQIAQMGVSERKEVGEWFGPNTVAQVLKKLTVYDRWSKLAVHVALDNLLIGSDVETMALAKPPQSSGYDRAVEATEKYTPERSGLMQLESCSTRVPIYFGQADDNKIDSNSKMRCASEDKEEDGIWRPLLIIVPLRLGLTSINRCYLPAIKEFFCLPQCTGIIGGRPNHALYFVGIADEQMIYLDPHICQPFVNLYDEYSSISKEGSAPQESVVEIFDDTTYHCPFLLSIPYDNMDPSLALSFVCPTKKDYDDLSQLLQEKVLKASSPPIFEMLKVRPEGFPEFVPYLGENTKLQDYTELNDSHDSFDEFEFLE